MKHILLFGAGKSASSLILFLAEVCEKRGWKFTICDQDIELIKLKSKNFSSVVPVALDVENEIERIALIESSDIVISMLPASLHFLIALDCLNSSKNLLTASYIDDKILPFKSDIEAKGLLFLYEMGLDPGIDHMSAMRIIDKIKSQGGKVTSFISHCGGLVAPENDNNPWHYKISWSSRNVVLAGKDGAVYKEDDKIITVPYSGPHGVFRDSRTVDVPGLPSLAWYPNRDSNRYLDLYHLPDVKTFIRTTLRYPAFNRGWSKIVNLGFTSTDDHELIKDCTTYNDWFNIKLKPYTDNETRWNSYLHMYITDPYKSEFDKQLSFLEMQSKELLPSEFFNSADIMQHILETKLMLLPEEKDMIVMLHQLEYEIDQKKYKVNSSLIVKGVNAVETAMAKTVGLPLGIATVLILEGQIKEKGLTIPVDKEIYEPVLEQLALYGIIFNEETVEISL